MKIDLTNIQINLYRLVPLALILWPAGNAIADYALSPLTGFPVGTATAAAAQPVAKGDAIAGYEVTSGYDLDRVHPVSGDIRPHYGVDLATPTGTKLIAPTDVSIDCWWDKDGGGLVAEVEPATGEPVKMLHLSYCDKGTHSKGDAFATTGATGEGTGAHLDARRVDKEPPRLADVEPYLTGELLAMPAASDLNVSGIEERALSDRELQCAIGAAEGTRNHDCSTNEHYDSHTDPGNGVTNQGSFSYQHGADSPKQADEKQMVRLRRAEADIQAKSQAKFGRELSTPALAAALDLWNQAPLAGDDFVGHLTTATPTGEQIVEARAKSYVNPNTGQLDAPGLGNDSGRVEEDQARRTGEVIYQLEKRQRSD